MAGDAIVLAITLARTTRLVLLTQGSTKIFKSPSRDIAARQNMAVRIHGGAALCFLPDPVQPYEKSSFEQGMVYEMVDDGGAVTGAGVEGGMGAGGGVGKGSLCVLDWVCRGRAARGEDWGFWKYASRNEIFLVSEADDDGEKDISGKKERRRLLLRDNLILDGGDDDNMMGKSVASRMDGKGVFGTLILYGPLVEKLARFFMDEFKSIPRIGGRKWDSGSGDEEEITEVEIARRSRRSQEIKDGLLWTAAAVRGCVVVKFGAREVEGGRLWLRSMLESEGTVVDQFGERALMCLR